MSYTYNQIPAIKLFGKKLSSDTPANGEMIIFNSAIDEWEASTGGSSSFSDSAVNTHSTTISDYTTPTAASASSNSATSPTYNFDFSSSTGWTLNNNSGSASITGGVLRLSGSTPNMYPLAIYDLGSNLDNTTGWVMRFKIVLTNLTNTAVGNGLQFSVGMSDTSTNASYSAESPHGSLDSLHYNLAAHAAGSTSNFYSWAWTNTNEYTAGISRAEPLTATRYIQITYTVASATLTVKVYTDEYSTLEETISQGLSSTSYFSDMRYIFARLHYQGVSDSNTVDVEDLKIYNGMTTVSSGTTPNLFDNDTSTKWSSNSESNPYCYVDFGSATNITSIALYYDATTTTETQIKIQTSEDATTWTDVRTINTSALTDAAWNYYRFNIAYARYLRIYGNSGAAKILSIWEVKGRTKTAEQVLGDLGMLAISSSDATLDPDGT